MYTLTVSSCRLRTVDLLSTVHVRKIVYGIRVLPEAPLLLLLMMRMMMTTFSH